MVLTGFLCKPRFHAKVYPLVYSLVCVLRFLVRVILGKFYPGAKLTGLCKRVAFHDLKAFSGDFSDELSLLLDTKTAFMDPETIWVLRTNQHSEVEWGNFLKHFSYSPEYEFVLIFTLDKAYRLVYSAVAWSLDC